MARKKTGEKKFFLKIWDDREDNEHLAELLSSLDSNSANFRDRVYQGLKARYPG